MSNRILILDGYRAVAIGMVLLYHYFARWTPPEHEVSLYPYGSTLSSAFAYGYLGVHFFFIISGFVIGMTLNTCKTPFEFVVRRFARLWPAMLACSIITFAGLSLIPGAPFEARARDLVPGLIFTSPQILNLGLGTDLRWLDGAYWSLFVEVSFYAWATVLFFVFRGRFGLAFLGLLAASFMPPLLDGTLGSMASIVLVAPYMPWFCAGIGFYHLHARKDTGIAFLLVALSAAVLVLRAWLDGRVAEVAFGAVFYAAFLAFVYRPTVVRLFSTPGLTVVGEGSYSLYLLHQFLGVAIIGWLADGGGRWTVVYAVAVAAVMVFVAIAIYRFWEVPTKRLILSRMRPQSAVVM